MSSAGGGDPRGRHPGAGAAVAGRRIVLCVTGGIAAYKVVQAARDLALAGADVRVAMTAAARRFVGAQTFASLTGNPVATDLFTDAHDVPHVELAREADLVVVAPATADVLAKMAAGIADDLVTATLLTAACPVVVVPAMHTEMWEHAATRANVATLAARGVTFVGPSEGELSSGDTGAGRLVEPDAIVAAAVAALERRGDLAGRRVVVTAGGTQEPIDPVRYVGNRSSGRMGFALAAEARRRGADVVAVVGAATAPAPAGVEVVRVRSAEEMRAAVTARAGDADVVVMAAAVADFRPAEPAARKLKKAAGPPEIALVPTPDILAELGRMPGRRAVLVGFAAETERDPAALGRAAEDKRVAKGADLVVANDVASADSGFEVGTTRAVVAGPDGIADAGLTSKDALAALVVERVVGILAARDGRAAGDDAFTSGGSMNSRGGVA
ncbi:MAG TPA: bifunctional phosphopantothenoylcysteine decarboxylase/phosphopantothenate--cysteine ligase CoaBC [Actinomycetota bacterium]|nr:bifunctional phosphopantothenoylcysteine decarboxylase/phosphopantothenate--cysteine ligase CoaBC [Actinomycetota bacterium]